MNHCFNKEIADNFDLNIATFLQSIAHWTHNNLTNKRNLIDGYCWTFNTLEALRETFTYWSKKQLETVINNAIKSGLLIKSNHNQTKYDRTCWYALTPAAYAYFPDLCEEHFFERMYSSISPNGEMEYPEWRNQFPQIGTPIPITNPITKKDNTISDFEIKTAYEETLPECPKIQVIDRKLSQQLKKMQKDWPKYSSSGQKFSLEAFKSFLIAIKAQQPRFLKPYPTKEGNLQQNNLRTITTETNLAKLVNGEFNFK